MALTHFFKPINNYETLGKSFPLEMRKPVTTIVLTKLSVQIILPRQQSLGEGTIGQDRQPKFSTKGGYVGFAASIDEAALQLDG
jgi:hypothetical protein